jgi:CPA1 family monovalent cation:H+ antiporter
MSPSTRVAVESFWEYLAFALNSIVFLLIGFQVSVEALLASWKAILVAWLAVTLGRAVIITLVSGLLRRSAERMPWSWSAVLTWGGLRGGLSMVLVLGLPASFPHRDLLITMTFGVVIVSILAQGLTMGPLLRRLLLVGAREDRERYETHRGAARAKSAAIEALDKLVREGTIHAEVAAPLREEYQRELDEAHQRIRELHLETAELREEERLSARRQLVLAEKDAVLHAFRKGWIGGAAFEGLLEDIDARLARLEHGETGLEPASPEGAATPAAPGPGPTAT